MEINTLLDYTKRYLSSIFFPLTLMVLSFLIWILPFVGSVILAIVFSLLSFLPLLSDDGRGYIPLLIAPIIMTNQDINFSAIPFYLYIVAGSVLVSMILRIVLYKLEFKRGDLMVTLAVLFGIFLISYFYNSAYNGIADSSGLFFLLGFFGVLIIYVLLSIVLGKNETMSYLSRTIAIFALAISAEILVYYIRNGFDFAPDGFSIGWSYTAQSASTLLILSLPFFSIMIADKKPFWFIGQIVVIFFIIALTADSGILALLFAFIPLVLLTYRSYGKLYPYIVILLLVGIGTTFIVMLATSERFNTRVMTALQSLNFFNEKDEVRASLYSSAVDSFKLNPVIGTSVSTFSSQSTTLVFPKNTFLSVAVLGGLFGFIAYVFYEINLYVVCLKKKSPEKWLFFTFLLLLELIGLIDNTITNLSILLVFLVCNAVYQMSDRPDDVIVHEDDFKKVQFEM